MHSSTTSYNLYTRIKFVLFSLIILLASSIVHGQTDGSIKKNDSVNGAIIKNFNQKIADIESQRLSDSIKKATLELK